MGFEIQQNEETPAAQGKGFSPSFATYKQRGTSPLECWYSGVVNQTAYSATAIAFNNMVAHPVVLGRSGFLDRIAFEVTTLGGAGAVARCGIYANTSRSTLYPSSLIVDGGEFATDGSTGIKSSTISQFLQAGIYWLAFFGGIANTTVRVQVVGSCNSLLGIPATMGASTNTRVLKSVAYAALPATWPSGSSLTAAGQDPVVHVRFAS